VSALLSVVLADLEQCRRLAAVDMHTAQHIVEKCFSGSLAEDRTIILVTHHITLCLPLATYLVELSHGRVLHKGSIQRLRDQGILDQVVEAQDEVFPESEKPVTVENEVDFPPQRRKADLHAGKLVETEVRAEGRVSLRNYLTYIQAAGIPSWIVTLALMLLIRLINVGNQVPYSTLI
jgi:ABC-type multidrug transport system ATPase subunit